MLKNIINLLKKPINTTRDWYFVATSNKYCRLMRLNSPWVFPLLWLPACTILFYGGGLNLFTIMLALLFAIAVVVMRSAGCIINDIFDRKYDGMVQRTKNRPLATGEISVKMAVILCIVFATIGLLILLFLPRKAVEFGFITGILTLLYPLAKRFTNLAQVVLGFVFNMGIIIAWYSVRESMVWPIVLFYLGNVFITISYDTIYALQDIDCDEKLGLKSLPIFLKKYGIDWKNFAWSFYKFGFVCLGFFGLGDNLGLLYFFFLGLALYLLYNDLNGEKFAFQSHFQSIWVYLLLIFVGVLVS